MHANSAPAATFFLGRDSDSGRRPSEVDDVHPDEGAESDAQRGCGYRRRCHGAPLPAVQVPADVAAEAFEFAAGGFAGGCLCRLLQHSSSDSTQLVGQHHQQTSGWFPKLSSSGSFLKLIIAILLFLIVLLFIYY